MRKLVTDVKVIPGEEVALQHQLLVCDMRIDVPPKSKRKFTPHLKIWKLKDPQMSNHFQVLHVSTSASVADGATEDILNNIKTGLLKTTEEVCGTTLPTVGVVKPGGGMNTWKKPLLPSGNPSRSGRQVKALGHHTMQPNAMPDIQCTMLIKKPTRSSRILTPSLQKSTTLLTSLEERTLMLMTKNDAGEMSMSKDAKQKTWLEHYQRLLNVEFD